MVRVHYPCYQSITIPPTPLIPKEGEEDDNRNAYFSVKEYRSDQICIWIALVVLGIAYAFCLVNLFCIWHQEQKIYELVQAMANSTEENPVYLEYRKKIMVDWPCHPYSNMPLQRDP